MLPTRSEIASAVEVVDYWRLLHADPMYEVAGVVESAIHLARAERSIAAADVSRRLKRLVTIVGKLDRFPSADVTGLHDIGGVRAVLPSISDLRAVAEVLKTRLDLTRPRDYIAHPPESGYRAVHLVAREAGVRIEIQLRTALQDSWANLVEQIGADTGIELKFGHGPKEIHDRLRDVAIVFAHLDSGAAAGDTMTEEMSAAFQRVDAFLSQTRNED
jgi:ppGpp synthetase/RelA/SpoT-type nucleotidyltranferase